MGKQHMPEEPTLEGKPASAWGWFLASFVYLCAVALVVIPAAFTSDPQRDAFIESAKTRLGESYNAVAMVFIMLVFVPFLVMLDRAVVIKHNYRKERDMVTKEEQTNYDKGNFFKVLSIVFVPVFIAIVIYVAINR